MSNKLEKEIEDIKLWSNESKTSFDSISFAVDSYWIVKQGDYNYCNKYEFNSLSELKRLLEETFVHSELDEIIKAIYVSIMKSRPVNNLEINDASDDAELPDYIYAMQ